MEAKKNPHKDHRRRMRQRFLKEGLHSFSKHNQLEYLLFYCVPVKDTNVLAHRLLERFGSISAVLDAPYSELLKVDGIGEVAACFLKAIPQISGIYLDDKTNDTNLVNTAERLVDFVRYKFTGKTEEEMLVMCLDCKLKVISYEFIAKGTVNASVINKRKIAEIALFNKASSVVIAHNHPQGLALPSQEDMMATKTIATALKTINVRLLDSLVVADDDVVSIAQSPMLSDLLK